MRSPRSSSPPTPASAAARSSPSSKTSPKPANPSKPRAPPPPTPSPSNAPTTTQPPSLRPYVIYGLLPNRVPTLMYEGAPNTPGADRFWDIIARHKVTQLYTAPTAIRTFMKWGDEHPKKHDLSSLSLLGTVGEPINPEAWI